MKNKYTPMAALFAVIGVFLLTHFMQMAIDRRFPSRPMVESFNYLPSGTFLKGAALAYDEMLADYFWIQALAYFGGHSQADQRFPWLAQLLDVTTTLDPYFEDPYEFGGIAFGYVLNDVVRSNAIFAKGMANVPRHHNRYWYLPFFTAFNYMYYKGDYATAARYLEQAAQFPERPAYLPLLVARLYANTEDPALAIPFLEQMVERAATPKMKEQLEKRIAEIQVKDHLWQLNAARSHFRQTYGREPHSLDELVSTRVLDKIPTEPFGGRYFISPQNGEVVTSTDVDALALQGAMKPESKDMAPLPFRQPSQTQIPFLPTQQ